MSSADCPAHSAFDPGSTPITLRSVTGAPRRATSREGERLEVACRASPPGCRPTALNAVGDVLGRGVEALRAEPAALALRRREPTHVLAERLLREHRRQLGERLARGQARAPRSAARALARGRRSTRSGESAAVHCALEHVRRLVALEPEVRVLAVVRQLAAEARQRRRAVAEDPADRLLEVAGVAARRSRPSGPRAASTRGRRRASPASSVKSGGRRRTAAPRACCRGRAARPRGRPAAPSPRRRCGPRARAPRSVQPSISFAPGLLLRGRRRRREHGEHLRLAEDLAERRRRSRAGRAGGTGRTTGRRAAPAARRRRERSSRAGGRSCARRCPPACPRVCTTTGTSSASGSPFCVCSSVPRTS